MIPIRIVGPVIFVFYADRRIQGKYNYMTGIQFKMRVCFISKIMLKCILEI